MFDFLRKASAVEELLKDVNVPVAEVLGHAELCDAVTPQSSSPASVDVNVLAFTTKNFDEVVRIATQEPTDDEVAVDADRATVWPRNAALLLARCPAIDSSFIFRTVRAMIRALAVKNLHPVAAENIYKIVVAAFTENHLIATGAIQAELVDAEVLHSIIRHLSHISFVGELLLGVLGGALSADLTPTTQPEMFAAPWIRVGAHAHLCSYVKVAMADPDAGSYFAFMSSLFQNGVAPHIGQLVDEILAPSPTGRVSEQFVADIVDAAEDAAANPAAWPNLGEGIGLLSTLIAMIGSTLPQDYTGSVKVNATLLCAMNALPRVAVLMQCDTLPAATRGVPLPKRAATTPAPFGYCRLKIVELIMSVYRITRKDTDDCIFGLRFVEQLMALAVQYPCTDVLLVSLEEIFSDALVRSCDDEALLTHLVCHCGLLEKLVNWSRDPRLVGTSLRAIALHAARPLAMKPAAEALAAEDSREVAEKWRAFVDTELNDLVSTWSKPITGRGFEQTGSLGCPKPVHRPTVFESRAGGSGAGGGEILSPLLGGPRAPPSFGDIAGTDDSEASGVGADDDDEDVGSGRRAPRAADRSSRYAAFDAGDAHSPPGSAGRDGEGELDPDFDATDHLGGLVVGARESAGWDHEEADDDVVVNGEEEDHWIEKTIDDGKAPRDDTSPPPPPPGHRRRTSSDDGVEIDDDSPPPPPPEEDDDAEEDGVPVHVGSPDTLGRLTGGTASSGLGSVSPVAPRDGSASTDGSRVSLPSLDASPPAAPREDDPAEPAGSGGVFAAVEKWGGSA